MGDCKHPATCDYEGQSNLIKLVRKENDKIAETIYIQTDSELLDLVQDWGFKLE